MLKLKLRYFGHLMWRADSLEKTLMLGKIEGRRRRGWQRMRWLDSHHWLDGHEFEQAPGDGEGQRSLACCSPWGLKESNMTERLNNNKNREPQALKNFKVEYFMCCCWVNAVRCRQNIPNPESLKLEFLSKYIYMMSMQIPHSFMKLFWHIRISFSIQSF